MSETQEHKKWIMYKKAIKPLPEYIPGMKAHWSGLDEPVNNSWIDRINGYKLTPSNANTFKYIKEDKLWHNTAFSSVLNSNFAPGQGVFTVEIVLRNLKETVGNQYGSGIWGNGAGFIMYWSEYNGPLFFRYYDKGNIIGGVFKVTSGAHLGHTVAKRQSNMIANGLDTITYGSACDGWNGIRMGNGSSNGNWNAINGTMIIGGYAANQDRNVSNLKVHAIRWYPFVLTEEQIAHNYECDKQWYKLEGDEK